MPDSDPALDNGMRNSSNRHKRNDSNVVINRPDDPVFKRRGFNRSDRTAHNKIPVWGIITEPLNG